MEKIDLKNVCCFAKRSTSAFVENVRPLYDPPLPCWIWPRTADAQHDGVLRVLLRAERQGVGQRDDAEWRLSDRGVPAGRVPGHVAERGQPDPTHLSSALLPMSG